MTKTALRAIVSLYEGQMQLAELQMATLNFVIGEGELLGRLSKLRASIASMDDEVEAAEMRDELNKAQDEYEASQSVARQELRDLTAQLQTRNDQAQATLNAIKTELGEVGEQGTTG